MGKDEDHKKRIGPIKFLPPVVITLLLEFAAFLSYNLGISIPALAVSKHSFGAATITSLGAFGFKDVTVPFTRIYLYFTNSFHEKFNYYGCK